MQLSLLRPRASPFERQRPRLARRATAISTRPRTVAPILCRAVDSPAIVFCARRKRAYLPACGRRVVVRAPRAPRVSHPSRARGSPFGHARSRGGWRPAFVRGLAVRPARLLIFPRPPRADPLRHQIQAPRQQTRHEGDGRPRGAYRAAPCRAVHPDEVARPLMRKPQLPAVSCAPMAWPRLPRTGIMGRRRAERGGGEGWDGWVLTLHTSPCLAAPSPGAAPSPAARHENTRIEGRRGWRGGRTHTLMRARALLCGGARALVCKRVPAVPQV